MTQRTAVYPQMMDFWSAAQGKAKVVQACASIYLEVLLLAPVPVDPGFDEHGVTKVASQLPGHVSTSLRLLICE